MGVVYTATDPRLDRQVAIKVLPPDLTRDDAAKRRFLKAGRSPLRVGPMEKLDSRRLMGALPLTARRQR